MAVRAISVLGTFPVTQQIIGAVVVIKGIIETIVNLAALAFHNIQKWNNLDNGANLTLTNRIKADKEALMIAASNILEGFIVMIPIIGSVCCGIEWYIEYRGMDEQYRDIDLYP